MNDPELLKAAAAAAKLDLQRFAAEVLDVDARNVRSWISGEQELQGTVRVLCKAILERPRLARELARTRRPLREGEQAESPAAVERLHDVYPHRTEGGFTIADSPDGVHPWLPAEEEFADKIEPSISRYLALAEQCVMVGNTFLGRAADKAASPVFQVQSFLLIRTLHDLRCAVLCTLAGYPRQAWTVAGSAFEAANMLGHIGQSEDRALAWLHHDSEKRAPTDVYTTVTSTLAYLGLDLANPAKRQEVVAKEYDLYRELCMAKHINPIAERTRYLFLVNGVPNLMLTPAFTKRRIAEARLGLLLALRSAHIALWAFDITHLAEPGLVDDPLGQMALELDELIGNWKNDLITVESSEVEREQEI